MDVQFETQEGQALSLEEMTHGQTTLVVFVRHLGWPICREFLTQLRERVDEIKSPGVAVYVVAPHNADFIAKFLDAFGAYPFPVVGDPKRQAYREMGHRTMAKMMEKWKLLSKALLGIISGKVKNFIPKEKQQKKVVLDSMRTQDVYIQGGSWLFTPDGKVVWKHIDESPEDHATVNEILHQMNEHF